MSEEKLEKIHSIFVELDCLLDTRLGTLAAVDDNLMMLALENGFIVRNEENFPPLEKSTFLELYKTRDKDILKISPMTMCVDFIKDLSFTILKSAVDTPLCSGVEIVINTHPYNLTNKEAVDLITSFAVLTNKFISIKLVNLSYEQLTPSFCVKNFASMFFYQYDSWLDVQATNNTFKNVNATKLIVYGPKIFFNRVPTFEEKRKLEKDKINIFEMVQEMAASLVDLNLLDIAVFSVDITKFIEKEKTT